MRNGDDEDAPRLNALEKAVWKSWDKNPVEATTKRATALRELEYSLIGTPNCRDEIEAKVFRLVLVVARRRDELRFGFGMEFDASHRSVERAFSNT